MRVGAVVGVATIDMGVTLPLLAKDRRLEVSLAADMADKMAFETGTIFGLGLTSYTVMASSETVCRLTGMLAENGAAMAFMAAVLSGKTGNTPGLDPGADITTGGGCGEGTEATVSYAAGAEVAGLASSSGQSSLVTSSSIRM